MSYSLSVQRGRADHKHDADDSLEYLYLVDPHVIGSLDAASMHYPAHSSLRRSRNSKKRSS